MTLNLELSKKQKFYLKLAVSALIMIAGLLSVLISGRLLEGMYPEPVRPDDIILDRIPKVKIFASIKEVIIGLMVLMSLFSLGRDRFKRFPEYMTKIGILYGFRAFVMALTPLAQIEDPTANSTTPFFVIPFYEGMFFSGHAAFTFMLAFLEEDPRIKCVLGVLATMVSASAILAHSHYSIDIVGGILAGYTISKLQWPSVSCLAQTFKLETWHRLKRKK